MISYELQDRSGKAVRIRVLGYLELLERILSKNQPFSLRDTEFEPDYSCLKAPARKIHCKKVE